MLALLALSLAVQDVEIIRRTDRIAYEEAVDLCRKAEARIASEPAKAIEALSELIDKRPLRKMECTVRIEVFADAPGPPVPLLPFQLRGKARRTLAAAPGASRRLLLEQALEDFEASAAKGVASSADLARGVRVELLALLKPGLDRSLHALLKRMEADQQGSEVEAVAAWLSAEAAAANRRLEEAPKGAPGAAAKEVLWCDAAAAALAGLASGRKALADIAALRARAAALAAYRGRIRLKISASPYAEVTQFRRDGKDLELAERWTPLVLPGAVDIGDLEVELRHPTLGKCRATFEGASMKDGASYVLVADLEKGTLTLTPLP